MQCYKCRAYFTEENKVNTIVSGQVTETHYQCTKCGNVQEYQLVALLCCDKCGANDEVLWDDKKEQEGYYCSCGGYLHFNSFI